MMVPRYGSISGMDNRVTAVVTSQAALQRRGKLRRRQRPRQNLGNSGFRERIYVDVDGGCDGEQHGLRGRNFGKGARQIEAALSLPGGTNQYDIESIRLRAA